MSEATLVTQVTALAKPDASALASSLAPLVNRAAGVVVSNAEEHGAALEIVKELRLGEKRIADHFEPARKALDLAKKEVLQARDSLIQPLVEARLVIDRKAVAYEQEAERRRADEQRRLEEQARKDEEERQLLDAIAAEEAGDKTEAEAIMQQPVAVPLVHVEPAVSKVAGVSASKRYSATVTDKMALIRYVAEHPEWAVFLDPNMPALNRMAVTQREALSIPGVQAVSQVVRSVKAS